MAQTWESIALLMICLVFGSLYVVKLIEDERLDLLKSFFFLYGMLNICISGLLFIPIYSSADPTGLGTFAIAFGTINALFILLITWTYGVFLFEKFFDKTDSFVNGGRK